MGLLVGRLSGCDGSIGRRQLYCSLSFKHAQPQRYVEAYKYTYFILRAVVEKGDLLFSGGHFGRLLKNIRTESRSFKKVRARIWSWD